MTTQTPPPPTLENLRRELRASASAADAKQLSRYFKTGPGEYGEGDRFLGLRVPAVRRFAREYRGLSDTEVERLLRSEFHEERLLALFLLVERFERGDEATRRRIVDLYLASTDVINNWDLVDTSSPQIIGGWFLERDRRPLRRLARSNSVWERRIAILATYAFIKREEYDDTFAIAEMLLGDRHDLIHKGSGWMLREVGNRNPDRLRAFLERHAGEMPRTMLRYAIEKLPEEERRMWMARR